VVWLVYGTQRDDVEMRGGVHSYSELRRNSSGCILTYVSFAGR
jgi:hypothetical protein